MNDSTRQHCSEALSAVFIVALSAISLVALFGNSLVVITFFKNKNLRTSSNYYIVNMAASDVLCLYCNWLVYSTESMLTGRRWISHDPLASFLCKIGMYLRGTSQIVSVLSLVLIAVDRCFAIVFRFINRRGDVKELRCDNGSNFVGSERELKKSLRECSLRSADAFPVGEKRRPEMRLLFAGYRE